MKNNRVTNMIIYIYPYFNFITYKLQYECGMSSMYREL